MNKNIITFTISVIICAITAWLIFWGMKGLPPIKIIVLSIPIGFAAIMTDFFINAFILFFIDEVMGNKK
jgi:hypothetical protein